METQETTKAVRRAQRFETIVLAADGSVASRKAAVFAGRLAVATGARLHVVHVNDGHVETEAHFREEVLAAAALTGEPSALETTCQGDVGRELVAYSESSAADLIVMGTRAALGKSRLLADSVAGDVIRHASSPVLVVPETASPPAPDAPIFRRPLVATDYGAAARAVLRATALLVRGSVIEVLHVIPDGYEGRDLEVLHGRARELERGRAVLEDWATRSLAGLEASFHARTIAGMAPASVIDIVVGGAHDLVACGTRNYALSGCVAEALLDAVTCPVLVHRGAREIE